MKNKKHIVVIGGGFAGLAILKQLSKSNNYDITLVDLNNYNFFPPLLYQVAAGFMEPSAISYPFRKILRPYRNVRFRMDKLIEVVAEENKIILERGELAYDILVMATGTQANFFGNENIEQNAMAVKSISDALALRNSYLVRLERASRTEDAATRKKLLSYAIAGAGPTGVELSGIFAEMRKNILQKDFPELKNEDLGDIYLIDGSDSVLKPMSETAQKYTYKKLLDLGVKIKLNTLVKDFRDDVVYLSDGTTINSRNLIWTAGVTSRIFAGFKKEEFGPGGRMLTDEYNRVLAYDNIYALGDTALVQGDPNFPEGHPQVAQPAIQQGRNLGKNLIRKDKNWKAFRYQDKGSLAIIGRNKAVADLAQPNMRLVGFSAWFIWAFVHIRSLVNFKTKVRTFFDWTGYYFKKDQSFRMIIRPTEKPKFLK